MESTGVHDMSKIKYGDIIELKSLNNPPVLVQKVLTSTLVLLGDSPKSATDWLFVRKALRKLGKDSFIQRIKNCAPEDITLEAKKYAQSQVADIEVEDAKKVSMSVASLLFWVKATAGEVEQDENPKKN